MEFLIALINRVLNWFYEPDEWSQEFSEFTPVTLQEEFLRLSPLESTYS